MMAGITLYLVEFFMVPLVGVAFLNSLHHRHQDLHFPRHCGELWEWENINSQGIIRSSGEKVASSILQRELSPLAPGFM